MNTTKQTLETKHPFLAVLEKHHYTLTSGQATAEPDGKGNVRFAFRVSLFRDGVKVWADSFFIGTGHIKKMPKAKPGSALGYFPCIPGLTVKQQSILRALVRNPFANFKPEWQCDLLIVWTVLAHREKLQPTLIDVMYCLLSDGSAAFDNESFVSWCANFGYDDDSRKAESIYRACITTGEALQKVIPRAEIEELRALANEY